MRHLQTALRDYVEARKWTRTACYTMSIISNVLLITQKISELLQSVAVTALQKYCNPKHHDYGRIKYLSLKPVNRRFTNVVIIVIIVITVSCQITHATLSVPVCSADRSPGFGRSDHNHHLLRKA